MVDFMACPHKNQGNKIQVVSLELGNGWSGTVVLSDTSGRKFSIGD
jgi:hypothetical protein